MISSACTFSTVSNPTTGPGRRHRELGLRLGEPFVHALGRGPCALLDAREEVRARPTLLAGHLHELSHLVHHHLLLLLELLLLELLLLSLRFLISEGESASFLVPN